MQYSNNYVEIKTSITQDIHPINKMAQKLLRIKNIMIRSVVKRCNFFKIRTTLLDKE
jgi:hypothetical protein